MTIKRSENRRAHKRLTRLVVSVLVATLAAFSATLQPSSASATSSCQWEPYGDIGWYWHLMGGQEYLGCPLGSDEFDYNEWSTSGGYYGRGRTFQKGEIAWFPFDDRGPFLMMVRNGQGPDQPVRINWWIPRIRMPIWLT